MNRWRNRLAYRLINLLLDRLATRQYRAAIAGSIEYGLRAAARDELQGNPPPEDWRPMAKCPFFAVDGCVCKTSCHWWG